MKYDGSSSGIFALGFFGALVFYLQQATGFWMGVLGFLKAMIWPAMLVYRLFVFLYR